MTWELILKSDMYVFAYCFASMILPNVLMYSAWLDTAHHLFPKNQAIAALLILHSSFKLSSLPNIESHEWAWIPPKKN